METVTKHERKVAALAAVRAAAAEYLEASGWRRDGDRWTGPGVFGLSVTTGLETALYTQMGRDQDA